MIPWLRSLFTTSVTIEGTDTHGYIYGINYRPLYAHITRIPGVILPRRPHYLWTGSGTYAEFILNGHTIQIEGDPYEDALWISPKDGQPHPDEIRNICEHLEQQVSSQHC
ncbi:hypothetical protein [Brevifollis gellanilyticus]|uniref:Uncharacterized protein n=1 Tax=Brevifollis gellanilyticus TaxID=748831 RepID=A0A512MHY0_9BACT|nr:hypothetical protein [Brevifollis gellanilyticus]GEP46346.1 hypothetical protein BGE01nite_56370 [Brevifollis gellanilyticus]